MIKKIALVLAGLVGVVVLVFMVFFVWMMVTMRPIPTGPITDGLLAIRDGTANLFLIKGESSYIAVDAGMNPEKVARELENRGIDPAMVSAVFLTHSDTDHSGGLAAFPSATVYLPEREEPLVLGEDVRVIFGMELSGENPLEATNYTIIETGAAVTVDGRRIAAVPTPGHSSGSTSYIVDDKWAFVGDMALVRRGSLAPLPRFINNDHTLAAETARRFDENTGHLKIIATAHDGLLIRPLNEKDHR